MEGQCCTWVSKGEDDSAADSTVNRRPVLIAAKRCAVAPSAGQLVCYSTIGSIPLIVVFLLREWSELLWQLCWKVQRSNRRRFRRYQSLQLLLVNLWLICRSLTCYVRDDLRNRDFASMDMFKLYSSTIYALVQFFYPSWKLHGGFWGWTALFRWDILPSVCMSWTMSSGTPHLPHKNAGKGKLPEEFNADRQLKQRP